MVAGRNSNFGADVDMMKLENYAGIESGPELAALLMIADVPVLGLCSGRPS
jgi:hypothetical protein